MGSPYVTSSRGGGRRPQLPAFCRTRRPTVTVNVSSLTALRNLLDNALRHTPNDGPVELSLETRDNRVRFVVRDHGPGIPPAIAEAIGKPFITTKGNCFHSPSV